MKGLVTAALAAGVAACAALAFAEQDIDFKGTALGVSEQDFKAKHSRYRCRDTGEKFRALSDRTCTVFGKPDKPFQGPKDPEGTFASVPADVFVSFYDDRLHRITVNIFASHFGTALQALNARYGTPDSIDKPIVKNRMGAEFENVIAVWKRGDISLKIEKYGYNLDTTTVSFATGWGSEEFKKRRGQDSTKAAGDI